MNNSHEKKMNNEPNRNMGQHQPWIWIPFKPIFELRLHQIYYFKGFHIPLELCTQIKTLRWCSRLLCCTYLRQGEQGLWPSWCHNRGVLGTETKSRARWNWFQSIPIGVKEEEEVVLTLEIGFQAMHQRKKKKKKKRSLKLRQMGRMMYICTWRFLAFHWQLKDNFVNLYSGQGRTKSIPIPNLIWVFKISSNPTYTRFLYFIHVPIRAG